MEAPFERFLDQLDRPVSCIIADTWLPWMAVVGGRRNVPVLSLWTQAPSMFSIFYHFELLAAHKHFPDEDLQERGEEVIDYLPGLSPMRLVDLPNVIVGKEGNVLKMLLDAFSFVTKAQGLIFTSWYELQPQVTSALKADLPIPVYTIGPSIPYFSLQSPSSDSIPSYFRWLDSQPESSVLFVSLGSYIPLSSDQMEEIFMGLNASQIRYLWIVRGEISSLQGACGELGLIVPWCEQLRVLCHPSVGGFMTHCGWNSVMEGIFAGVPMLGFPLAIDQFHNCKLIVEDWKIGLRLKKRVESRHVVGREDVAQSVKRLMNLNGSERIKLIRSAQELEETCTRAIKKGGSTDKNVNDFVKDFVKGQ
ncbi:Crocetin glucosyltransferase [Bertholletia excelsa]